MGIHWIIFALWAAGIVGIGLMAMLEYGRGNKWVSLVPLVSILAVVMYFNADAGSAQTDFLNAMLERFPGMRSELVGDPSDGLSMFEYWVNKDTIDLYAEVYSIQFYTELDG